MKNIKKLLALLLTLVMVFCLASCGPQDDGGAADTETPATTTDDAGDAAETEDTDTEEPTEDDGATEDPYADPYADPYTQQ